MRTATILAWIAALALGLGSPVCCVLGDCCDVAVAEQAEPSCCCCDKEEQEPSPDPQPDKPDCDCPLHASSHASGPAHDPGPMVAVLDGAPTPAPPASALSAERHRAPPRAAHAAVRLPLLL